MASSRVWIGRALSALVVTFLVQDGATMLFSPEVLAPEMSAAGFPLSMLATLGMIAWGCAFAYAVPPLAPLGAILLSAFAGGAVAIHVRLGEMGSEPQLICVGLIVAAWTGLYLRDARIAALLPLAGSRTKPMLALPAPRHERTLALPAPRQPYAPHPARTMARQTSQGGRLETKASAERLDLLGQVEPA